MPTDATAEMNLLITTLERRDRLSAEEKRAVESLPLRIRTFSKGDSLADEWSHPTESCIMLDGFAARVRTFHDGQSQILAIQVAGDFVDLHSFVLRKLDHSVVALSAGRGGFVPHEALSRIINAFPHLARVFWTLTEVDSAIQRNWNAYLGRRGALERLACLLCEMFVRLQVVNRVEGQSFTLPLSQAELADLLGLSVVHTNRIIQELRGTGMVEWSRQTVIIRDWTGLQVLAEFDRAYLSLNRKTR